MADARVPNRRSQWWLTLLLVLVLAPLSAYWLCPVWVPTIAARFAHDHGLKLTELDLERPGWTQWRVNRAVIRWHGAQVVLERLNLEFQWQQLIAGRLQTVIVDRLALRLNRVFGRQPEGAPGAISELPRPLAPGDWFARLPWRKLEIRSLQLSVPEHAFEVTGRVEQHCSEANFSGRVIVQQPALQRDFRLVIGADDGLTVTLLNQRGDAVAVNLALRSAEAAIGYALAGTLLDDEVALMLSLLGYPKVAAELEVALEGQLPLPLPRSLTLGDLAMAGRFAGSVSDATGLMSLPTDIKALALGDVSGTFEIADGRLSANVSSGRLEFSDRAKSIAGSCAIDEWLRLMVTTADVTLGEGLQCLLRSDRGALNFELTGFGYQRRPDGSDPGSQSLQVALNYAADIGGFEPTGDVQLEATIDVDSVVTGAGTLNVREDQLIVVDSTEQAVSMPFTFRLMPDAGQGEVLLQGNLQFVERIFAVINGNSSASPDLGSARLSYEGHLHWRSGVVNAGVKGRFSGLRIHQPQALIELRPLAGTFEAALSETELTLAGELQPGTLRLPVALRYDLEEGRGALTSSLIAELDDSSLDRLFVKRPLAYDLISGQIAGDLTLKLVEFAPSRMDARLRLREAMLRYEDYRLRKVQTALTLNWWPERLVAASDLARIGEIDLGFAVTDLQGEVRYELLDDAERLYIDNFRAQLLGGVATSERVVVDLMGPQSRFNVGLEGVSLAQLVALEGEEVSGTGTVDGLLPIELSAEGFRVRDGVLVARPPGGVVRISERFTNPTGEPGLDFALKALSDFTYDELTASVDYAPTGDLALGVRLKGRNPAIEQGRQINYNVNVSENVPTLLQSLKADRLITDEVERRVNR